jgi:hypothetical protein
MGDVDIRNDKMQLVLNTIKLLDWGRIWLKKLLF